MIQPNDVAGIRDALFKYGPAPGAKKMLDHEMLAAQEAMDSGIYVVFRSMNVNNDCTRVSSSARCFCGHNLAAHQVQKKKRTSPTSRRSTASSSSSSSSSPMPSCSECKCHCFRYIHDRPEEVGQWYLPRRRGFNVNTWRAKCKCAHTHEEHDPVTMCNHCRCTHFHSDFLCLACDKHWEEHETVFETRQEREAAGRSTDDAFKPLADFADMQDAVFNPEKEMQHQMDELRIRPAQDAAARRPERSVRLMHHSSGGTATVRQTGPASHRQLEYDDGRKEALPRSGRSAAIAAGYEKAGITDSGIRASLMSSSSSSSSLSSSRSRAAALPCASSSSSCSASTSTAAASARRSPITTSRASPPASASSSGVRDRLGPSSSSVQSKMSIKEMRLMLDDMGVPHSHCQTKYEVEELLRSVLPPE